MVKNASLGAVVALTLCLLPLTNALVKLESGFALLDIHSQAAGFHATRICTNFQQFFIRSLPDAPHQNTTFNLGWWNDEPNTFNVCAKENSGHLNDDIIPLEYVSSNPTDTGVCRVRPNEFYIQSQIRQIQKAGAAAALFLLDKGTHSDFHDTNFLFTRFYNPKVTNDTPVFYMYKQQFEDLYKHIADNPSALTTLQFYLPPAPFLDAGVYVLLALSTGCILIGCLWYSYDLRQRIAIGKLDLVEEDTSRSSSRNSDQGGFATPPSVMATVDPELAASSTTTNVRETTTTGSTAARGGEPEKILCCNATGTCMHVCYAAQAFFVVALILTLSFFYRPVAVEVFNVFTIVFGTLTMQKCAISLIRLCIRDPVLPSIGSCCRADEHALAERWYVPAFVCKPFRPVAVLLLILAFAFAMTWRIKIGEPYAYLMLDAMNVCICIYAVKASELRSLRLITFFLIGMFIYDIVMVFGTRLITPSGCSVMVQVVTGTDCTQPRRLDYGHDWPVPPKVRGIASPQKVPILFYVPLLSNPVGHCFDPEIEGEYLHMMLGLGDVIAPGYLIAFAFYLDVRKSMRFHLYGFTTLAGYALGMITTFVSLKLMETAQPALIYLVPFTLTPLILLCLYKGTLREAWRGDIKSTNSE